MRDIGEDRRFIRPPNTETPMLYRYRESHGGTLILEYPPIVTRSSDTQTRWLDAVLLHDTPSVRTHLGSSVAYHWNRATQHEREMIDELVETTNTEVLQAKNAALGPYLLGQAFFSPRLTGNSTGVAIAGPGSPELLRFAHALFVKVVQDSFAKASSEPHNSLITRDPAAVERYHRRVGGSLVAPRSGRRSSSAGLIVDAIILPDTRDGAVSGSLETIRGERAIAVCSTKKSLGMYVMGAAVCAQMRLRELGASQAEVAILCKKSDRALTPLLRDHPGITVIPAEA